MAKRPHVFVFFPFLLPLLVVSGAPAQNVADSTGSNAPSRSFHGDVHLFFYLWYGNPTVDGRYFHWNHSVIPHWHVSTASKHQSGALHSADNIGAPFYPARGLYSSADYSTLVAQFNAIHAADVDVVSVSWWGRADLPQSADGEGVKTDSVIPTVLRAAEQTGMKICFHLEPYPDRTPEKVKADLHYIHERYASSPAFLPIYYVYDSYHNPASEWARLLTVNGDLSIRGTSHDGIFLSLYLDNSQRDFVLSSGFDGIYTYFAAKGFTSASNWDTWMELCKFAQDHGKLFVPSVAPGYDDGVIRPWNRQWHRDRRQGQYYEQSWKAAMQMHTLQSASSSAAATSSLSLLSQTGCSAFVSVTSFNEWGEGTQIEEAVPKVRSTGKKMEDYSPENDDFYMRKTEQWVKEWRQKKIDGRFPVPKTRVHDEL